MLYLLDKKINLNHTKMPFNLSFKFKFKFKLKSLYRNNMHKIT